VNFPEFQKHLADFKEIAVHKNLIDPFYKAVYLSSGLKQDFSNMIYDTTHPHREIFMLLF